MNKKIIEGLGWIGFLLACVIGLLVARVGGSLIIAGKSTQPLFELCFFVVFAVLAMEYGKYLLKECLDFKE